MKLVVIGGSAGAHTPLKTILGNLPAEFDAAVIVLRHAWPSGPSYLAWLLGRHSVLPVREIADGLPVEGGHVYVPPPGQEVRFIGERDIDLRFRLVPSAPEQIGKPNISLTLEFAAPLFGEDCIGVILSGYLDDGATGAIEVDRHDGVIIVQAPSDAEAPSMPLNVIQRDSPAYILPDTYIANVLRDLVSGEEVTPEPAVSDRQA